MKRALLVAQIVIGIGAGASAVLAALAGDWTTMTWALCAAMWIFVAVAHRCPAPPAPVPPARGVEMLVFEGGPLDGGEMLSPTTAVDQLMEAGAELTILGAEYRVKGVHHTAWVVTAGEWR
ncbi:hypothetical protein [Brachybacterium squillarum]|uniref:hypothetical protein n=1 Tax=Brachybacterium squillarum TaxID=661979 RepID=UPI0022217051|nr:hypothetical protein [Brachybacterium squillarum]MCW1805289.1 hypothetical protein [Brachybacterium squillarum]